MKILYVHIGRAQTATTAIQSFLNMNSEMLERWDLFQMFEESNKIVAREYMGRPDGRMFLAPPPERP